jgi:hypothetical protein
MQQMHCHHQGMFELNGDRILDGEKRNLFRSQLQPNELVCRPPTVRACLGNSGACAALAAHSSFVICVCGPHRFMHSARSLGVSGMFFLESCKIFALRSMTLLWLRGLRECDSDPQRAMGNTEANAPRLLRKLGKLKQARSLGLNNAQRSQVNSPWSAR